MRANGCLENREWTGSKFMLFKLRDLIFTRAVCQRDVARQYARRKRSLRDSGRSIIGVGMGVGGLT